MHSFYDHPVMKLYTRMRLLGNVLINSQLLLFLWWASSIVAGHLIQLLGRIILLSKQWHLFKTCYGALVDLVFCINKVFYLPEL